MDKGRIHPAWLQSIAQQPKTRWFSPTWKETDCSHNYLQFILSEREAIIINNPQIDQ